MNAPIRHASAAVAALAALTVAAPASALLQRTFVASYGLDTNPCNLPNPCRTFNTAIGNTLAGGEVVILDTAGYGPMTINKSLKVIGPAGVYGGISVQGGGVSPTTGIVINAGNGDDIILRGLDINGVPVSAPFPLIGIDVQNAGAVHIEKSSIGNFTQDVGGACINVNVANTTRVWVVDSFLRECNTGIFANSAVAVGNSPSVIVDNTRIERGRTTGGVARGVWMQGYLDVSLRNSMISRQDVGIQFDNPGAGNPSRLAVINSQLMRATTLVQYNNTIANARAQLSFIGSQIIDGTDAVLVSNSAVATTYVKFVDTYIGHIGNNGFVFSNSGAGNVAKLGLEFVNSTIAIIGATAIDVSATNGSQLILDLRDSTMSGAITHIKTSGSASNLQVALTRSTFHHGTTAIDHGQGTVQLDSTHFNYLGADFIDNGGGSNIVSNGLNMEYNVTNAPGPTYITPTIIPKF